MDDMIIGTFRYREKQDIMCLVKIIMAFLTLCRVIICEDALPLI
jgi:hypothetical protein